MPLFLRDSFWLTLRYLAVAAVAVPVGIAHAVFGRLGWQPSWLLAVMTVCAIPVVAKIWSLSSRWGERPPTLAIQSLDRTNLSWNPGLGPLPSMSPSQAIVCATFVLVFAAPGPSQVTY